MNIHDEMVGAGDRDDWITAIPVRSTGAVGVGDDRPAHPDEDTIENTNEVEDMGVKVMRSDRHDDIGAVSLDDVERLFMDRIHDVKVFDRGYVGLYSKKQHVCFGYNGRTVRATPGKYLTHLSAPGDIAVVSGSWWARRRLLRRIVNETSLIKMRASTDRVAHFMDRAHQHGAPTTDKEMKDE